MRLRSLFALMLPVFALTACDSDPVATNPAYPVVEGVYDYSAPVREVEGARWVGTLTIIDTDPQDPEFHGTYFLQLMKDGVVAASAPGIVVQGRVSEKGAISFHLDGEHFRHEGSISGSLMTGAWVNRSGEDLMTGNFFALRR